MKMDFMERVMIGNSKAKEDLDCIRVDIDRAAKNAAEKGMDSVSFCGLIMMMIDTYQAITKISNEKIEEDLEFTWNIRPMVNSICGVDPLEMSGI